MKRTGSRRSILPRRNAFFPSAYSLSESTRPVSDLSAAEYPQRARPGMKILVIAADERYLPMDNGTLFSTGNHPVETLLPMYHLHQDEKIVPFFGQYQTQFRSPKKISEVVAGLGADSEYAGVFIPGGHGALIGLPESEDVYPGARQRSLRYLNLPRPGCVPVAARRR